MEKELLEQIVAYLKSIKSDIPSSVETYDLEKKLDKLIEIQEKQLDISEQILEKLGSIYHDMPAGENSLDNLESKFDKLIGKVDTANNHLRDIASQ